MLALCFYYGKFGWKGIVEYFRDEQLGIQQVWIRILRMVHETMEAKSEIILPLEKGDAEIVNRFGI